MFYPQIFGIWEAGNWSDCNATCGNGYQFREVYCIESIKDQNITENDNLKCDNSSRPDETRNCTSSIECPEWIVGPWSECSKLCGEGVKNRSVTCSLNYSNDSRYDEICDNLPYRPERYVKRPYRTCQP